MNIRWEDGRGYITGPKRVQKRREDNLIQEMFSCLMLFEALTRSSAKVLRFVNCGLLKAQQLRFKEVQTAENSMNRIQRDGRICQKRQEGGETSTNEPV